MQTGSCLKLKDKLVRITGAMLSKKTIFQIFHMFTFLIAKYNIQSCTMVLVTMLFISLILPILEVESKLRYIRQAFLPVFHYF